MPRPIYRAAFWVAALLYAVQQPAEAQQSQPLYGLIHIDQTLDAAWPSERRPVLVIGDERSWASSADYPAAAIAANEHGSMRVRVSVDAAGRVTGCMVLQNEAGDRLAELACTLVRKRGRFRHALSAAGTPIAAQAELSVHFMLSRFSQIPTVPMPPPPGIYRYTAVLAPQTLPDWRNFAPVDKPDGEVAVILSIYPRNGDRPETRRCRIERGSGNSALDAATCEAVKTGEYRPLPGASLRYGNDIKLLVRWKLGDARAETPSRELEQPAVIEGGDDAARLDLPTGSVLERGWAELVFKPDGRVGCRVVESTGKDATDVLICTRLTGLAFTPAEDLYGRKVPEKRYFRYDP